MSQQWSGQTGGTHWMQRALVGIIRHTGLRFVYGCMHLWLVWYILVRPTNRRGAYLFHRKRGRTRTQAAVDVYRSFYHFGQAILDRFAVYAGEPFEVEVENRDLYYGRMDSPEGFIMLFSHVGNTEIAGYYLSTPDKPMHIVLYGGESPVVMEKRRQTFSRNNIDIIDVQPDNWGHIYRINEVLQKGDVLALAADRKMGDHTISCPFLGADAQWPTGAFRICQAMKQPVLLVFVIKEGTKRYRVFSEELQPTKELVNQYAAKVEQMALKYPYQWFNFYDFWAR